MSAYLLDTHTLLWWWGDPERLSPRALGLIRDPANAIAVSAATAWEISTKHRIGKLPDHGGLIADFDRRLVEDGFARLPISVDQALRAGSLPGDHRDPFDRMLAAQGLIADMVIIGRDCGMDGFGVKRVW